MKFNTFTPGRVVNLDLNLDLNLFVSREMCLVYYSVSFVKGQRDV